MIIKAKLGKELRKLKNVQINFELLSKNITVHCSVHTFILSYSNSETYMLCNASTHPIQTSTEKENSKTKKNLIFKNIAVERVRLN